MKCPNCKETNLVMSVRKGVEIDYCPDCRGVWLDRGELDKIIEKHSAETVTPSQPTGHSAQHYDKHYDRTYKRKKSFLEDLFD